MMTDDERRAIQHDYPMTDQATCSACGETWDDAVVTSVTPTPAGRCPFEYEHPDPVPCVRVTTAGRYAVLAEHHDSLARECDEYAAQALDEGNPVESALWVRQAEIRRTDADTWRRAAGVARGLLEVES